MAKLAIPHGELQRPRVSTEIDCPELSAWVGETGGEITEKGRHERARSSRIWSQDAAVATDIKLRLDPLDSHSQIWR